MLPGAKLEHSADLSSLNRFAYPCISPERIPIMLSLYLK